MKLDKDTVTTIVGIATLVATIAQLVAQFFGALDAHTANVSIPATNALGIAALGFKAKGA